ncbi:phospholipase A2 [Streptomyces sp. S1]|uniref:phospholipase A2 n=1 Tax=Streptomyces sp. S1 TaxID=718288 RepID=UPI000EF80210|nr:phospholipase A2 [Streptomyces sp. S1]
MRRTALPVIAALSMALLLPQSAVGTTPAGPQAAGTGTAGTGIVDPPAATGEFEEVGPGMYSTGSQTFEIAENDVSAGSVGRRHTVAARAGDVAKPESAPVNRPDMGVFGPGWEAEFLGGELNQKLEQQGDAIVVTDLGVGESTRYLLKSSLDAPDGGWVKKYETAAGDRITDTARWDAATGTLVSTVVETLNVDLTVADEGQPTGASEAGDEPVSAADLKPTRTWKQVAPGTNAWRVTGSGNAAYGVSTVTYDSKGRVSTITEPAVGEALKETVAISYAASTTASGTKLGDYTGRAKEVKVTTGTTTQTLARYAYDSSGLLRSVTNPVESSAAVSSYVYDSTGRVSDIVSPDNGDWDLAYPTTSASPDVLPAGPARPSSDAPIEGASGITDANATAPPATDIGPGEISDPEAYPRKCSWARHWLYYWKTGCAAWAAHYGWHKPYFKWTKTGYRVVGINNDGCSTPGPNVSRPGGWNFRPACDMHDYGYGLIGNTYKGYAYYLDRRKKVAVDDVFYTTLRDKVCAGYFWKKPCRATAWTYRQGVRKGNPKNGANKT